MTTTPPDELRRGIARLLDPARLDLMSSPAGRILNGVYELICKLGEKEDYLDDARKAQDRLLAEQKKSLVEAHTAMRRWRMAASILGMPLTVETAWLGWMLLH